MSYLQLFVELMTNGKSPFSEMRFYGFTDLGTIAGNFFSVFLMWLGKGLAAFLDACEEFANAAYNFISFSGSSTFVNLYNVINSYLFVPLLIIFGILAIKFALGTVQRGESKTILQNLGILFFVVAVLPSIFSFVNKEIIGQDFLLSMQGDSNGTSSISANGNINDPISSAGIGYGASVTTTNRRHISDDILRSNTYDFWYLYNKSDVKEIFYGKSPNDVEGKPTVNLDNLLENLQETQNEYINSNEAKALTFSGNVFDPNIGIDEEHGYFEIPDFFRWRVLASDIYSGPVSTDGENIQDIRLSQYTVSEMWNGFNIIGGEGWGHECYLRYNVDYLNLFIQLIAVAIMYFAIGYSVFKLIIELIIHQLFGATMAAMDLTGGQRIKKYLGSIIGIYLALLLSALTIMLFMPARNFACNLLDSRGLGDSLVTLTLAMVMLDIPNIIARYFNINTGIRGGMAMAGMGLMAAGRMAARQAGRMARAPFRAAGNTYDRMRNNQTATQRDAARRNERQAERASEQAERQRENQERENQRQRERQEREAQQQARDEQRRQENEAREAQQQAQKKAEFDSKQKEFEKQHGTGGDYERYEQPIDYDKDSEGADKNKDAIVQRAGASSAYNDFEGKQKSFKNDIQSGATAVGATEADTARALKANPSEIVDAKKGMYSSISSEAVKNGGTQNDYREAAQKTASRMNAGGENADYVNYLADASYNSAHSEQIRARAKNIQSMNRGMSDQDAYVAAMDKVSGNYQFTESNKSKIAAAELRDYGSLRNGNIYGKRPDPSKYKVSSKSAL